MNANPPHSDPLQVKKRNFYPLEERCRTIVAHGNIDIEERRHIHMTWRIMLRNPNEVGVTYIVPATAELAKEITTYLRSRKVECFIMDETQPHTLAYHFQSESLTYADVKEYVPPQALKRNMIDWNGGKLLFVDLPSWKATFDAWLNPHLNKHLSVHLSHESEKEKMDYSVIVLHYFKNTAENIENNRKSIANQITRVVNTDRFIVDYYSKIGASAVFFEDKADRQKFLDIVVWSEGSNTFSVEERAPKDPSKTRNAPQTNTNNTTSTTTNTGGFITAAQLHQSNNIPNELNPPERRRARISYADILGNRPSNKPVGMNIPHPESNSDLVTIALIRSAFEDFKSSQVLFLEKHRTDTLESVKTLVNDCSRSIAADINTLREQLLASNKSFQSDLDDIKITLAKQGKKLDEANNNINQIKEAVKEELREEITNLLEELTPRAPPPTGTPLQDTVREMLLSMQAELQEKISTSKQDIIRTTRGLIDQVSMDTAAQITQLTDEVSKSKKAVFYGTSPSTSDELAAKNSKNHSTSTT